MTSHHNQHHKTYNNTNYNNNYHIQHPTTSAIIPATTSPEPKKLTEIKLDCATNTPYADFSHTISFSQTLKHIKDVILFKLCANGFKGSLDDIILRTSDNKLLQLENKTLHDIFTNLKDSKIFVHILGEVGPQREVERQSSVPDLESRVPLNSTDSGIGTPQSFSEIHEDSSTPIRKRSSTLVRETKQNLNDQIRYRLNEVIRTLDRTKEYLDFLSLSDLPEQIKHVLQFSRDKLTICIDQSNLLRSLELRNELSTAYFKLIALENNVESEQKLDSSSDLYKSIIVQAHELVKNIETKYTHN